MTIPKPFRLSVPVFAACLLTAANGQPWKDKKVPYWTEEDAKLVMTASPWAKSLTPEMSKDSSNGRASPGGMGGRRGGVSVGGIGFPGGMGGGRRGGGGGGGGYPRGGGAGPNDGGERSSSAPPVLTLRWESALPMREAELKARDTSAPTIDEDHYAIAVYGVPRRMAREDSKKLAAELKKHASLKRDGKKDLKPSSVEVLQREDGPVIVYLFPRTAEITKQDRRVEFFAEIGRLKFAESFFTEDMVFDGRLEL
jgi:hypothetical protein